MGSTTAPSPTSVESTTGEGAAQARSLVELLAAEVDGEISAAVAPFVDLVRERHGDGVAAVLFYGSCLRGASAVEGVLDFYAIVDSYAAAYRNRLLAWTNAALPPNVYYVELEHGDRTLRAKYNVMTSADFARAATGHGLDAIVWGRFSQPFRIAYARDRRARESVIEAAADAVRTMVAMASNLLGAGAAQDRRALWSRAFAETYGTELRTESAERIAALYDADPAHYDLAADLALADLRSGAHVRPRVSPRTWALRKRAAKLVYVPRLLKSAWTFGDWLPYALWKFERHSGEHIALSERQRRHPLVFGWPIIVRILREGMLR
jgi:hypothetical protein